MPRRKKRWWKPRIKTASLQSIIALVLILSAIILVAALLGDIFGAKNFLNGFTTYTFGLVAYLLPLLLMIVGLNLTKIKHPVAEPRALWGVAIAILGFVVMLGSLSETLGGVLGAGIGNQISTLITPVGGFIAGFALIFAALLITFDLSLHELVEKVKPLANLLSPVLNRFTKETEADESAETKEEEQAVEDAKFPEVSAPPVINTHQPQIEIVDDEINTNSATQKPTQAIDVQPLSEHEEVPYSPPPLSLLEEEQKKVTDQSIIEKNAKTIEATLSNFGIQARIAEVNLGPAVTQYAINLAEGTRSSKITSLQNDLALSLASPTGSVRIESPIPGKRLIGIEVPNQVLTIVKLKRMLTSPEMQNDPSPLAVALGEDVSGRPTISHVGKWPHILIAGSTGSGKSVLVHTIINSILFRATPEQVQFIMVDPKRVELTQYNKVPHLRTPVIVDVDKTVNAFKWAVEEMEKRYRLFQQIGARNLEDFNQTTDTEQLPYIVIIVDELADLMVFAANEMETLITRIAQKARATGIHMVLSTQRPSVDVITGLIKANIPTRIALNVSSSTDSRVILDSIGAEKLLGKGDMLYLPPDAGKPKRIQGVFLSNNEIAKVTDYMQQFVREEEPPATTTTTPASTSNNPELGQSIPQPLSEFERIAEQPDDDKFFDAVRVIANHDKASASLLQRRLKVGYARAARILDELEAKKLVGPPDGSNPREVYMEVVSAYVAKMGIDPTLT
ncbi:DNA translocase FtsK 4TM domain-containing protein [candidate division WWE3 bacterium]|uniref:DNA translocase FtsK 4TM domain-containing protein n=1 Tax=candidate division WWE3 bacterium TaxID=2053526 RepID=A0A955RQZ4_UNCKA|nr:DNA translocase FtsK 4TM domain-containing protein [candidate division WWE3 bacterium]